MLKLLDLIQLAKGEIGPFKIHFAAGPYAPLLAFYGGTFKQWQERQNRRNFECNRVVALIQLHGDKWLFAGLWDIHGCTPRSEDDERWYEYSTGEAPGLDHLTGRVIVAFKRSFRASYVHGVNYADSLEVVSLLSTRMQMADFPGFSSVLLSFEQLQHVVQQNLSSWMAALKSVAGVYLITDLQTGKLYVGSAYGEGGIWARWVQYAEVGHGNNVELRLLLDSNGSAHSKQFQFTILEICDILSSKDQVLCREGHWKSALGSRQFGYNRN